MKRFIRFSTLVILGFALIPATGLYAAHAGSADEDQRNQMFAGHQKTYEAARNSADVGTVRTTIKMFQTELPKNVGDANGTALLNGYIDALTTRIKELGGAAVKPDQPIRGQIITDQPIRGQIITDQPVAIPVLKTKTVAYFKELAQTPQEREKKNTPLMLAARDNVKEAVIALLAGGANPNVTNTDGVTPLMTAAYNGGYGSVQALVKAGANLNAVSTGGKNKGKNALQYAQAGVETHGKSSPEFMQYIRGLYGQKPAQKQAAVAKR